MAFVTIPVSWIDVDSPITDELWGRVKDNEDALNAAAGGGPSLPSNGSFELDTDADGTPDNWTLALSAGGAGANTTVGAVHGAEAFKFTYPSGAGNGGGALKSDSMEVHNVFPLNLSFSIRREPITGAKNQVVVDYLNGALTTVGAETVYSSTVETSTNWIKHIVPLSPSASAVYAQISVVGGTTDVDSSGITLFDNVYMTENYGAAVGNVVVGQSTNVAAMTTVATKEKEMTIIRTGVYRVEYTVNPTTIAGQAITSDIRQNGTVIGVETTSTVIETISQDLTFNAGDSLQLFARATQSPLGSINDLFIKTDGGYTVTQAS